MYRLSKGAQMTFVEAIRSCYSNYFTFSGRSRRSEYWWFLLFCVIVAVVIGLVEGGGTTHVGDGVAMAAYQGGPIATVWSLVNFFPSLSVAVRRLHDLDKSGWWVLLILIPLVGAIILIVWFATKGTSGGNRFGPDPMLGATNV